MVLNGGITPCGAGPTIQLTGSGLLTYLGAAEGVPEGGDVWRARGGRRSCSFTTSKPLCRSISRYFIRFLEKDSSRKLIFFLIFGRRFLEKDDFQQDPLLFETRPTPSPVRKWQTDLPETRKCAVSRTKTFTNSDCGLRIH